MSRAFPIILIGSDTVKSRPTNPPPARHYSLFPPALAALHIESEGEEEVGADGGEINGKLKALFNVRHWILGPTFFYFKKNDITLTARWQRGNSDKEASGK